MKLGKEPRLGGMTVRSNSLGLGRLLRRVHLRVQNTRVGTPAAHTTGGAGRPERLRLDAIPCKPAMRRRRSAQSFARPSGNRCSRPLRTLGARCNCMDRTWRTRFPSHLLPIGLAGLINRKSSSVARRVLDATAKRTPSLSVRTWRRCGRTPTNRETAVPVRMETGPPT
jgi:hypothetical protein